MQRKTKTISKQLEKKKIFDIFYMFTTVYLTHHEMRGRIPVTGLCLKMNVDNMPGNLKKSNTKGHGTTGSHYHKFHRIRRST